MNKPLRSSILSIMNVLYPSDFNASRNKRHKTERKLAHKRVFSKLMNVFALGLTVIIVTIFAFSFRPLPSVNSKVTTINLGVLESTPILWPASGQAAIYIEGMGVVAEHGPGLTNLPVPSASTAKLFTALMVMHAHPFEMGESGQTLTITDNDVAVYQEYYNNGGSVSPVTAGESMTQLQALQALLLPSSNNIADMLAVWAYGSMENYTKEANAFLKSVGLTNTTVSDASGFSPRTRTTASDLTKAMSLVMADDVLASIVKLPKVQINESTELINTNKILGQDGIVGGKTGNTDEAGSCYVFAAEYKPKDSEATLIYGAVMAQNDMQSAMQSSRQLIVQAKQNLAVTEVSNTGKSLSSIDLPWGESASVVSTQNLSLLRWKSKPLVLKLQTNELQHPLETGKVIGSVTTDDDRQLVEVAIGAKPKQPSLFWRAFGRYL